MSYSTISSDTSNRPAYEDGFRVGLSLPILRPTLIRLIFEGIETECHSSSFRNGFRAGVVHFYCYGSPRRPRSY